MAGQKKVDLPGVVLGNILVPRPRRLREAKRAGELTRKIQGKIGHYGNVRGLEKSMGVFRLFEKLRYSNERSTIF